MRYIPVLTNVYIKSRFKLTRKKRGGGSEITRKQLIYLNVTICNWGGGEPYGRNNVW